MLSLFAAAVAGSGVAQAQECIARAKNTAMVRAEGITEVVAEIELRCRRPEADSFGFAADIPEELKITVELNTRITNAIGDDAVVKLETAPLTYASGGIDLVAHELDADAAFADSNQPITDDKFTDGELADDGNTIEWTEIPADGVNLNPETASQKGFNLVIKGLRANASALGDGEDITANVLVGGTAVNSAPLKVADVTNRTASQGRRSRASPVCRHRRRNGHHRDPGRFCERDHVGGLGHGSGRPPGGDFHRNSRGPESDGARYSPTRHR